MSELKCPKCGEVFQVDESEYLSIAKQVRDHEFESELAKRQKELNDKKDSDLEMAQLKQEQAHAEIVAKKDSELANKDRLIASLESKIAASETEKKLAVTEALQEKDKELAQKNTEIIELKGQMISKETESHTFYGGL